MDDKPMPNLAFNMMALAFKARDLLAPRAKVLGEVKIRMGYQVLDYGCGPGAFTFDLAQMVGQSGKVYALDLHPLAIERVQAMAKRRRLANVETICSDCETGLAGDSVDVVLLYDVFHMLSEPAAILAELHRVLKPGGTLSVLDPHLGEDGIVSGITEGRLFSLVGKGKKTYRFSKQELLH